MPYRPKTQFTLACLKTCSPAIFTGLKTGAMRLFGKIAALVTVVVTLVAVRDTSAARILMAAPIGTRSHRNFFMPLAEHLAQRNHTVTYIAGYESSSKHPNIRVVFVPDIKIFDNIQHLFTADPFLTFLSIYNEFTRVCLKALSYDGVQSLKDEKFDLVLLSSALNDCFLSFVHKLKVPFIILHPNKVAGGFDSLAGTPAFPSLVANFFTDPEYPPTFTGRMTNIIFDIAVLAIYHELTSSQDAECRASQLCPEGMPSFQELRLNSSLFITNSVKTMSTPIVPYTPTVVHAGGIHCRPANPLSEDLQQWVAEAGKPGFIYFSLGTFVKSVEMAETHRRVLVEVFGSLQQRVLWKWDNDTMDDLPPNVRLSKWLPQQDILGHPQLRLFITHGGMFSLQEATYHGVPVLGVPVSVDQHQNMRLVQWEGWGRVIHWEDLTYDNLRSHILEVMDDPSIRKEVQRRRRIMHDQPMSPGDWAAYWVEYVLRHQGATHLRSPAGSIPWYQLYNVDVWALLVVVTVVTATLTSWLCYRILLALCRCCRGSRKAKKD